MHPRQIVCNCREPQLWVKVSTTRSTDMFPGSARHTIHFLDERVFSIQNALGGLQPSRRWKRMLILHLTLSELLLGLALHHHTRWDEMRWAWTGVLAWQVPVAKILVFKIRWKLYNVRQVTVFKGLIELTLALSAGSYRQQKTFMFHFHLIYNNQCLPARKKQAIISFPPLSEIKDPTLWVKKEMISRFEKRNNSNMG